MVRIKKLVTNEYINGYYERLELKDFFNEQVKRGVEKHRQNFKLFSEMKNDADFLKWKIKNEEINFNATDKDEIMAMGIFLIALDEFEKELQNSQ